MKKPSFLGIVSAAALLAAALPAASADAVFAPDDEPDSLSWERFSQDRAILLHFLDWASTNPPPAEVSASAQAAAPESFPFVWVKAAKEPFTATNVWKVGAWNGEECLYCPSYTTTRTYQTIEVPEDGVYRFWIRQAHTEGFSESNFFSLAPALDDSNPAETPPDAIFTALEQVFCRANGFRGGIGYTRPNDPAPEILSHPTPPDGFLWEPTRKTAFLKKGRYAVTFSSGVVTTPRKPLCITDYVLVGDPFFSPEGMTMEATTSGHWQTPPQTRSPLYAVRPGAGMAEGVEPAPALAAWWKAWREALYRRLSAEERRGEYFWGNIAASMAFDEESNAIDRPSRLLALRESNAQPPDILYAYGDEFTHGRAWVGETGYYHRIHTARAIRSEGTKYGPATYEFDVPRAGTYHLWTLVYLSHILEGCTRGAMRIDVLVGGKDGRKVASYIVGAGDGSVVQVGSEEESAKSDADDNLDPDDLFDAMTIGENASAAMADKKRLSPLAANEGNELRSDVWNDSGPLQLPAGKVAVTVTSVAPPWGGATEGRVYRRIFCRAILTARDDYRPDLVHESPIGDKVGDGPVGFWLSSDPWAGVGRFSPAAIGRYSYTAGTNYCRVYDWTPLPEGEVNAPRHAVKAVRGERVMEILVIRNNTGETRWIEPAVTGDIPLHARLVAWGPTPDGSHTPRFLLNRRRIALPPYQNTVLWIDIDCAGAKAGRHTATLSFGEQSHTWDVDVEGSIEGVPAPLAYPWSSPFRRRSCWELYRDLGFNVISAYNADRFVGMSKKTADEFGFRLFVTSPPEDINDFAKVVGDWLRRGFDYKDFCFSISDEPGFGSREKWVARAKELKAVDPKARLWCNTGFFPNEAQWDACQEFMSYWDVFCPFQHAFVEGYRPPVDKAHLAFYREIGNPKIGYITPSTTIYWILNGGHEILNFARECQETGRDGWSSVRYQTETSWELVHPLLQPIFSGAWGRTLSTRYAETAREANQRWRKAASGIAPAPAVPAEATGLSGKDGSDGKVED